MRVNPFIWLFILLLVLAGCVSCKKPVTVPNAPINLTGQSASYTVINLIWTDNSDNETGFRIYRNSALIASIAANLSSYQDINLQPGTSYLYDIRAFNEAGESGASCNVTTPKQVQIPIAPTNLVGLAISYTGANLTWSDNSDNETGFNIYRNGTLLLSIGPNSTSYQDYDLDPGTDYLYDVRAFNEAGEAGNSCSVTTWRLPLNIEFNGWWVGGIQVNPASKAMEVTAYLTLSGGLPGVYTFNIMRDISFDIDQLLFQKQFAYDGHTKMFDITFLPPYATNESNTNGYHIDITKDGVSIWSMVNTYPPRLRVN